MKYNLGIPDTEEYYSHDKSRIARILTAIAIILALGPSSCDDMFGPIWASTDSTMINEWYKRTEVIGAVVFFLNPLFLFLANWLRRWIFRGTIRGTIVVVQWCLAGVFFSHLTTPWYPVFISGWKTDHPAVIEHPIFAACFYLSALLSGILWVTFRGDRQWGLRVLYEFLPFALLVAGRIWLAVATRPQFTWG
jgi:hypothetical protein